MTTAELIHRAAWLALTAAANADAEEVEQGPGETAAVYVARLVHYGATLVEGK